MFTVTRYNRLRSTITAEANTEQNTQSTFSDKVKLLDQRSYSVDPTGDLILEVQQGDASKSFRVSRGCMSRASSHWRAMLDPERGFQESQDQDKPVTLEDDSIPAMLILLLACHLGCQYVPKELDFQLLVDVCMVADKYDCITSLTPWLSMWMQPWMGHVKQVGYGAWTLIAWVTGEESVFRQAVEQLVLTCKTDDADQCLISSGVLFSPVLPPEIAETILKARYAIMKNALRTFHTHLEQYNFVDQDSHVCKATHNKGECDRQCYGSVSGPLHSFNMWPGKPEDIVSGLKQKSVADVRRDVKSMRSYVYADPVQMNRGGWSNGSSHKPCPNAASLYSVVDRLTSKAMDILLDPYRDHLKIQRQKLAELDILQLE